MTNEVRFSSIDVGLLAVPSLPVLSFYDWRPSAAIYLKRPLDVLNGISLDPGFLKPTIS